MFLVFLLFFHDKKFITDFREKAKLFNSFFAKQCSLITNTSELPTNCKYFADEYLTFPLLVMTSGNKSKA